MASWGPGLYQDDISEDVRSYYNDQLHRGKDGSELTSMTLSEFEDCIGDSDDEPVFWFALADTQWNLGRLEEIVKEKAFYHIKAGRDLKRWELKNAKAAKKRAQVLFDLESKLHSLQPPVKKITQYKLYHCSWDIGDTYAYRFESEFAKENGFEGKFLIIHKVDKTICHPGHTIPIVYLKLTDKQPESEKDVNDAEHIISFIYENQPCYRWEMGSTSARIIPKALIYIGKFANIAPLVGEKILPKISTTYCDWKLIEKKPIARYLYYNKKQHFIPGEFW